MQLAWYQYSYKSVSIHYQIIMREGYKLIFQMGVASSGRWKEKGVARGARRKGGKKQTVTERAPRGTL